MGLSGLHSIGGILWMEWRMCVCVAGCLLPECADPCCASLISFLCVSFALFSYNFAFNFHLKEVKFSVYKFLCLIPKSCLPRTPSLVPKDKGPIGL